jgi:hypothetical protein
MVCHASATSAIEPVIIPAQNFTANKTALTATDTIPSKICAFFLSIAKNLLVFM